MSVHPMEITLEEEDEVTLDEVDIVSMEEEDKVSRDNKRRRLEQEGGGRRAQMMTRYYHCSPFPFTSFKVFHPKSSNGKVQKPRAVVQELISSNLPQGRAGGACGVQDPGAAPVQGAACGAGQEGGQTDRGEHQVRSGPSPPAPPPPPCPG